MARFSFIRHHGRRTQDAWTNTYLSSFYPKKDSSVADDPHGHDLMLLIAKINFLGGPYDLVDCERSNIHLFLSMFPKYQQVRSEI